MRKFLFLALAIAMAVPAFTNAATVVSVGFPPSHGDSALDVVLSAIEGANKSVDVPAYSFTSKRDVAVRVVAGEKANDSKYTAVTFLENHGVPVRLDARYAIIHNKYMVVDGDTVQTGSFNYTASAATRNAENVLLVQGSPELAKTYWDEFNRLWYEPAALVRR